MAVFAASALSAQTGSSPEPAPAASDSAADATNPDADRIRLLDVLKNTTVKPVRSLVVDRQMPLVGIKWGADIQGDVPLNGEPEGAAPTLREARLIFYRSFGNQWSAKLQANYNSEGQFEIGDTYLLYTGWKSAAATFGVFKPPYSLESLTSRLGLTFMERALPVAALSERRSTGLGVLRRTENAILHAGLYLYSPDENGQQEKGQALVARYVHAPLESKGGFGWNVFGNRGIWSGISLSYRTNAKGPNTRFRSLPEVATADDYFVDTSAISGADTIVRVGLEASKVAGPFSWQAEALTAKVKRNPGESVLFYGGYVFASWLLTGETRNYDSGTGEFDNVVPQAPLGRGGWGAWELAARASFVDLNDKDVIGGEQNNITLGLNWYLNERLRVQANLIKVLDVKRPGSEYDGLDPLIAALRLQWYLP